MMSILAIKSHTKKIKENIEIQLYTVGLTLCWKAVSWHCTQPEQPSACVVGSLILEEALKNLYTPFRMEKEDLMEGPWS